MQDIPNRSFTYSEKILVASFIFGQFLLHFIVNLNGGYGLFRDELYYIACSEHLSWGYVDQPPLSLFLLKISRLIFGDSLAAIRLFPAFAIGITMWMTSRIVKEMGGKFLAIMLALVALFASPIHMAMGAYYSMNSIDIMVWSIAAYLVLKISQTSKPSLWIALGILLGLGLLNKISVLFLGAGFLVGLLITNRKYFLTPWPYVAGITAILIFLPYVIWNLQHDLAHLEFIHNASAGKYSERSVSDFIKDILVNHNPFSIPLWIIGLIAIFFYKPLRQYSIIGWLFFIPFIILVLNKTSKGEYLTPAFVIVFASGAIFIEQKLKASVRWVGYAYVTTLVVTAIILLPLVMPVLSVGKYIQYADAMHMKPESNENKELAELPQFYADMFGWKEKAQDVARVYNTLNDEDKQHCAIFSTNYGRCGALDFYGKPLGLPPSIGNHNNYWIWGPRNYTGDVMIILGGDLEDHASHFESCTMVANSTCQYCMPYENHVNIFLCRGLKGSLATQWIKIKHYD